MKQTGELLKHAREAAKLSLSEVALSTKINPKILNAIENGDMTNLPAKTFLKGFVRSYALYLKMDADEVMKTFHAETGGTPAPVIDKEVLARTQQMSEPAASAKEAPTAPSKQRRVGDEETFSGLRAVAVAVIVVLIGVIIGVRELIEKYQREKVVESSAELKVSPLPEQKETAKKDKEEEKDASAQAAEPSEPPRLLKEPPPMPKEEPKKEEPVKVAEEKKEPVKVAEPTKVPEPAKAPEPVKPVAAAEVKKEEPKKEEPKKQEPSSILKSVKNEIILEALDKVEVKFKVHGQAKILSLAPTQVHTIFADEPMILDLSDGGAVNIILNGRERGVPGDLGKPKQVTIP